MTQIKDSFHPFSKIIFAENFSFISQVEKPHNIREISKVNIFKYFRDTTLRFMSQLLSENLLFAFFGFSQSRFSSHVSSYEVEKPERCNCNCPPNKTPHFDSFIDWPTRYFLIPFYEFCLTDSCCVFIFIFWTPWSPIPTHHPPPHCCFLHIFLVFS